MDDMYPIFKKAKDSKDTGGIHDFVEILKLYDKNEDKTILSKDLFRLLTNLGKLKMGLFLIFNRLLDNCLQTIGLGAALHRSPESNRGDF